jgi:isopentenyl-diphosphate delta-isomerase
MVPTGSTEKIEQFESRKADHIRLALDEKSQATGGSGLDRIYLRHEALPDFNFNEVSLELSLFSKNTASPLFVSSMTAGHSGSLNLNMLMAKVSEKRNWPMGVGSQRRQLNDKTADREWSEIRKQCPRVRLFGNIGIAQAIESSTDDIRRLADTLEAEAMIIHLNALQECMQPEGTPRFSGALKTIVRLVNELKLPLVIKETGCGFSEKTLRKLNGLGIAAVDIGGYGGTHWGRIEGGRSKSGELKKAAAETFADWGISTTESLLNALKVKPDYQIWGSGGVRSGLDAAKLVAMGAQMVGLAKPIIEAALVGEEALDRTMSIFEYEMKTAMFCTGTKSIKELQQSQESQELRVWDQKV